MGVTPKEVEQTILGAEGRREGSPLASNLAGDLICILSMASEELEKIAIKAANEAIQLERQGYRGMAVAKYTRATDILKQLCSLYPASYQNKVYQDYIKQYEKRIKELGGRRTKEALKQDPLTKEDGLNGPQRET